MSDSTGAPNSALSRSVRVSTVPSPLRHPGGIYGRYLPHDPPAGTFFAFASRPMEFDIEIECVALA